MKGGTRKRGKTWSYYFDTAQVGGKRKKIEKGGFRTKKEAEAASASNPRLSMPSVRFSRRISKSIRTAAIPARTRTALPSTK